MRLLISCLLLGLANAGEYSERFLTLYNQIVDSNNGYYSSHGVPYHSLENMLVETVDHGHETDSEAISYNIWLHAMYGAIADDFAPFNNAWSVIENYLIPQAQYNMDKYNPSLPVGSAQFSVGVDPIYNELKSAYGEEKMYVMHWLLDVDDNFGFGNVQGQCEKGPSAGGPSFVHMGAGSVWQGITYPTCDNFTYGGTNGFSFSSSTPNWHYN
ncbi:exoglucanase B-like, partial [Dendroctonus ponderosae]